MSATVPPFLPSGTWIYQKKHNLQAFAFDSVSQANFALVAAIGAAVANTTLQGQLILPSACKIAKVAVNLTAIDNVAGTDSFNIVVGTTGAYTQGNTMLPDNSAINGYPTQFAVAGNSVFTNDVGFSPTNFPGITTAAGGNAVLVPTVWDAVYPGGTVLTLRATTIASTGSITNLLVGLCLCFIDPFPFRNTFVPVSGW